MTKRPPLLSVPLDPSLAEAMECRCAQSEPTLAGLAEAVLPLLAGAAPARKSRAPRQKRYRDYVRERRRR